MPAVNVGSRQQGRERAANVADAAYDAGVIEAAVRDQLGHGRYGRSTLFGDGQAGQRIANALADAEITIQKQLAY